MKWCWVAAACFVLSLVVARGQGAAELTTQAQNAMANGDFATAAKLYDQIVTTYPSTQNIEEIQTRAGYAYLHAGDYLKAISELAKLITPDTKPEFRARALFFTGLAQFSQGHKVTDATDSADYYRQAEETMGTLIGLINQAPTEDNRGYLEDAMYYQSLAAYGQNKFDVAETDLNALLAKFSTSLQKPDYLRMLGSIYAVQASADIEAKKPADVIEASAQKAIDTFDQVIHDPNALVQANEAEMQKAQILFLLAQTDPANPAGFSKALDAFRLVRRKEDMMAIEQGRIDQLRAQQQATLANGGGNVLNSSTLLDRETSRLTELKTEADPMIESLVRMAQCYVSMKKPDEARTILHRLSLPMVKLTPDQQKDVDFELIYSYVLGGDATKADTALTKYLAKHPGDPQADSISVQIAGGLMGRKDYAGALQQAQRSLKDFPSGKSVGQAVQIEAEALSRLGRDAESKNVINDFVQKSPNSPVALQLLVTQGETQLNENDLNGALTSFAKVKDNAAAGAYQAAAAAYYIETLNRLKRYDEVITEANQFKAKFPTDKSLANVEVLQAIAMDNRHDPAAIATLQDVAKNSAAMPEVGSFALYYVVMIDQREKKIPEMIQAVGALRTAFPTAYGLISQATDAETVILEKEKRFDDAVAAYQPLVKVPEHAVAAGAQNKIGDVWLAAAKAMGSYQSLQTDEARKEAERRLGSGEQAYVATLKTFPDDLDAVGDAFQGLVNTGIQRRNWGLLKDSDLEDYLTKLCFDLTTPPMPARVEMAKAGLVFVTRDGATQYPAALDRFTKALAGSPGLQLTTQETDNYGQLLIDAKQYPKALDVFNALLATAASGQQVKLAESYYGLGAAYLAQGDLANAKANFIKMQSLQGGAQWSPHAADAELGMAEINEQSSSPDDLAAAKSAYATLMSSPTSGAERQAQAMLGYGKILEKMGHGVKTPGQSDIEYATHYYEQVDLFYGKATPELSAEGLFLAAQAYTKANDKTSADKDLATLKSSYPTTSWATKAGGAITDTAAPAH